MRALILLVLLTLAMMTDAASAQQGTFYDASGKVVGRSATDSSGTVSNYDSRGRVISRETTSGNQATVYDAGGRNVGRFTTKIRQSVALTVEAGQGYSMASDWTGTIDVAVTEGYVNYIATNADPAAHGVAEISGNASLYQMFFSADLEEPFIEPLRQKFQISLVIQGRSASQAKREVDKGDATWPDVMKNEITDDVIGILFKADENELRRGYLYLHPDQFDKLIGNLAPSMQMRFCSRQSVQSECDLIVRVDVTTKKFEPQS